MIIAAITAFDDIIIIVAITAI